MAKNHKKRRSTRDETEDECKSESKKSRNEVDEDWTDNERDEKRKGSEKKTKQKIIAAPKERIGHKNGTESDHPSAVSSAKVKEKNYEYPNYKYPIGRVTGVSHKGQVEKIIKHRQIKKNKRYLVKWSDPSMGETWESSNTVKTICSELLRSYVADVEKRNEVEAILEHKIINKKSCKVKYLIKWKDASRGETWESSKTALAVCPKLVRNYDKELEMVNQNQVEAVIDHEVKHNVWKYLVQWRDHSKGRTWETARRTLQVGADALDKFLGKKPKAQPVFYEYGACRKKIMYSYRPDQSGTTRKIDKVVVQRDASDTSDEAEEWEVHRIVDVRYTKDESREFLIRWKGYKSNYDSWEPEDNLNSHGLIDEFMAKKENEKNRIRKELRPLPTPKDSRVDGTTTAPKVNSNRSSRRLDGKLITVAEDPNVEVQP